MDIKEIIKERKRVNQTLKELDYKIGEHYMPIIQALKKNKDKEGLENLIGEIPDSVNSMAVYESLRELRDE